MFLINKPNEQIIAQFLELQKDKPFSYSNVGATRNSNAPRGYNLDHNRIMLGTGRDVFNRAIQAVRSWKMFDFAWLKLCFDNTPIELGSTVAILVNHFGFWSLNAARIVYVLEETNDEIEKFGFAYGTLLEHAERGEERFSVEYHKSDESVWYDLYAFSQPNNFWARLGYPASRMLQRRFATESKVAMKRAIEK
jgi:uncharacterized protein (UPF0548 family)